MITKQGQARVRAEIANQAAMWFVELSEGEPDAQLRQDFIRWLQAAPDHAFAYLQVAAFWEDAATLDPGTRQTRDELIALAKSEVGVVPLGLITGQAATGDSVAIRERRSSRRSLFALAATVLIAVSGGLVAWQHMFGVPRYATGIGEQRTIRLVDGSTLELNARTKVRIRYSEGERRVELMEGQLLARVAKDTERPFIVHSGDAELRAVGTVFDVYRKTTGVTVTVVEGAVAVDAPTTAASARPEGVAALAPPAAAPLILRAGEQVKLAPRTEIEPVKADVAAATAWTQRQLVFQGATLTEVVEEFNRYNSRSMVIGDPAIADTRISGVFSSTDPTSLLLFVRGLPEFRVEETDTEIRITSK